MARFSHKDAYIEFAGVDLTGESNSCSLTVDVGTSEITCFGDAWDEFVEDIGSWSIAIAGFTDQDPASVEDTLFNLVGGGQQFIDYRPQGYSVGYKFDGYAIMTSFSVGGATKGGCPFSAAFQGSGTPTRSAAV